MREAQDFETSRFATASDGLRLHYRDVGPLTSFVLPVVCLPGLTRTTEDFDPLASYLSTARTPRRVLSLDYRGRGFSVHDPDSKNYTVAVEAADVLSVLAVAGVEQAVFVGTSRGGLITMAIATSRPELILGTVLNDIGPVLEPAGLDRIRGYVGRLPTLNTWDEAIRTIQGYAGQQFSGLSQEDWMAFAQTTFRDQGTALTIRYDPALQRTLEDLDTANLPTLWPQFDALARVPLLVIRGQNSDLLSTQTADDMIRRHPDASIVTVPGQGHAPLLRDAPTLARIAEFALHCDRRGHDADNSDPKNDR